MESIKILTYTIDQRPDLAELANAIRTEVFIVEQSVERELEFEFEEESHHYLLYLGEKPAATARWRETNEGIKLERFTTLKSERKKGLGGKILQELLKDTIPLGKPIYLFAQIGAVSFYEGHGFVKRGEMFWEAGIEHYRMEYPAS
jgi:predicted GNAT family N-acyltransferase